MEVKSVSIDDQQRTLVEVIPSTEEGVFTQEVGFPSRKTFIGQIAVIGGIPLEAASKIKSGNKMALRRFLKENSLGYFEAEEGIKVLVLSGEDGKRKITDEMAHRLLAYGEPRMVELPPPPSLTARTIQRCARQLISLRK
ncbi:MAG: hypothetical protein WD887_01500 [Candidatus Saccharimonadales bacterium]